MKISLKQLKQVINEEVRRSGLEQSLRFDDNAATSHIIPALEGEIMDLAQSLSVEFASMRGEDPDAFIPEVESALKAAIEKLIKEFS